MFAGVMLQMVFAGMLIRPLMAPPSKISQAVEKLPDVEAQENKIAEASKTVTKKASSVSVSKCTL